MKTVNKPTQDTAKNHRDALDAFVLAELRKVGGLRASGLLARAIAAGLLTDDTPRTKRPSFRVLDRSLQRLRQSGSIHVRTGRWEPYKAFAMRTSIVAALLLLACTDRAVNVDCHGKDDGAAIQNAILAAGPDGAIRLRGGICMIRSPRKPVLRIEDAPQLSGNIEAAGVSERTEISHPSSVYRCNLDEGPLHLWRVFDSTAPTTRATGDLHTDGRLEFWDLGKGRLDSIPSSHRVWNCWRLSLEEALPFLHPLGELEALFGSSPSEPPTPVHP